MFVMATLYATTGSAPVKIRNLSPSGALIEGGVIPPPETNISLSRGSLTIAGKVMWRTNGRAGLRFESAACVADWFPKGRSLAPQQRVDDIVQQGKAAPHNLPPPAEPNPAPVGPPELARAKKLIESLAEDLAEDPQVVARHGSKLQALDFAVQLFGKLATEQL